MWVLDGTETSKQWIEIYNTTEFDIALAVTASETAVQVALVFMLVEAVGPDTTGLLSLLTQSQICAATNLRCPVKMKNLRRAE